MNNPYRHTPESKLKISDARKKYLQEHPDKHVWQTRKYGTSVPCEQFKKILESQKIPFIAEYEPLIHLHRFFSIDVAFPEKRIGIEINGRQHYDELGKLKPYYQKRHDLIEREGWLLYEIPYHYVFNVQKMTEMITQVLNSPSKIEFDYLLYQPRKRKLKYIAKHPNNIKYNYPPDEKLIELGKTNTLGQMVSILNIPQKALWSHLNKRKIKSFHAPKKIRISELNPNWRHLPKPNARKIKWPDKETLAQLIEIKPFEQIGKMFNTTGNNVRKWAKRYGLNDHRFPRGYWQKLQAREPSTKKWI